MLSEAVCVSVLQSTEKSFLDHYLGKGSSNLFRWLQKPRRIVSKDSSVIITKLFEDDIVENAKSLLEDFNSTKGYRKPVRNNLKYGGWTPSVHSKLEKIGGPQFSAWTREYIPAYRIQIDADRLKGIKFEGWRKCSENVWEVLLTNSQMVLCSFLFFIMASNYDLYVMFLILHHLLNQILSLLTLICPICRLDWQT